MFERFLLGETLEECYDAVAEVANRWLDMLDTQVRFSQNVTAVQTNRCLPCNSQARAIHSLF